MSCLGPGNKCSYIHCGKTRRSVKGLKLFRFPKDERRRTVWLENCGNPEIANLGAETLIKRHVCSDHFEERFVLSSGKLRNDAVPYRYVQIVEIKAPPPSPPPAQEFESIYIPKYTPEANQIKVEEPSTSEEYNSMCITKDTCLLHTKVEISPKIPNTEKLVHESSIAKKLKRMAEHIRWQSKLLSSKRSQISKLKKSRRRYSTLEVFRRAEYISPQSRAITLMQQHTGKKYWTREEKDLAVSLFNNSPSAYKFMKQQKIILPGVSTVKKWSAKLRIPTAPESSHDPEIKELESNSDCIEIKQESLTIAD